MSVSAAPGTTEAAPANPALDARFMELALTLGRRGLGRTWPNPSVGAVVVKDGVIVGRGWTQPGGRPHAETEALKRAGKEAKGATLYVTLEPCSHHGKTPPCVDAIIRAGVSRVVSALEDPNPEVAAPFPFSFPTAPTFSTAITSAMEQVLEVLRCSHVRVIYKPNQLVPMWPLLNLR